MGDGSSPHRKPGALRKRALRLRVRRAGPGEVALVCELVQRAYRGLGAWGEDRPRDVQRYLRLGEVWLVFVAGRTRPVATIRWRPKRDSLHVRRLAVLRAWRNRGVGGRLLRRVEARARRAGRRAVTLYTNSRWGRNREFYLKLGYRITRSQDFGRWGVLYRFRKLVL